jgi:chromosome segregation ATPase
MANNELQEARNSLGKTTMELREANMARCKAEEDKNELKNENSSLGLELFKSRKEARDQGEEAHKVSRRNKDLERENEELHRNINNLVIQVTQHEGVTEAEEHTKLAKHAAKVEAELSFLKKDYHEKALALEDVQLALDDSERARKISHSKITELVASTKEMVHYFRDCKDKIETELNQAQSLGEQSSEKLSDITRKQQALEIAHHKDAAMIEELRASARKMEFDYEITATQLDQTAHRLADALDRNSSLQVTITKLEEDIKVYAADLETQELELHEAQRIQLELEKNIKEEKVGSIGSTNIAWQKLEKLSRFKRKFSFQPGTRSACGRNIAAKWKHDWKGWKRSDGNYTALWMRPKT